MAKRRIKFRFNVLYLIIPAVLFLLWRMNANYGRHTVVFFGFAENKDTEINRDFSLQIKKVHVTPGTYVKAGDLLLEVSRSDIEPEISGIEKDVEFLKAETRRLEAELRGELRGIEARKQEKLADIEANIRTLEAQLELNKKLMGGTESVQVSEELIKNSPDAKRIQSLRAEKALIEETAAADIARINNEMANLGKPSKVKIAKMENEKEFLESQKDQLSVLAPSDGLIGNVHCKEGEHIRAFTSLISFYEENPTLVKAYVRENLLAYINVGDSIDIKAAARPENLTRGMVTGLGSRIVEVPERLRKIPEQKTYAREVLISIPSSNTFLQKEKVVVDISDNPNIPQPSFFDLFSAERGKGQIIQQ